MTAGDAARLVIARAPTRLDFGGGWTDVPPYDAEQGGCVCNIAIARHATVRLGASALAGGRAGDAALLEAALRGAGVYDVPGDIASDFPVGAGLGGSSAAGVAAAAAAAAWTGEWQAGTLDRQALAERSRSTEVDELGVAGGRQDHYAAAFGGALGLHFGSGPVRVERIELAAETREALERQLVLVYTGESRISAVTISAVLDSYRRRERRTVDALARMGDLARQMIETLGRGDVDGLGRLLGEHWGWQRALHEAITTPRIETIVRAATAAGALGAKALGASGGGCVVVAAPAGRAEAVRAAVAAHGTLLPFVVDEHGVEVEEQPASA